MKKILKRSLIISGISLAALYFLTVGIRAIQIRKINTLPVLTQEQALELDTFLDANYPERTQILKSLPYSTKPVELDVWAKSAIAIDATNGNILYEKNADQIIPPASMTKLVVMYVVFQEIATGRISLEDVVPLTPDTWACNMPPHSSLMFLGKNQKVTLEELMLGLAIASGNDASHAIANYVSGGMDNFIQRMNEEVKKLGLVNTHFVETSGYSEENLTTAREMASFAKIYLEHYPESLAKFHSALSIKYPQEHNLAPETKNWSREQDFSQGFPQYITMPIYQKNTNPLLGKLAGCDGLKTGYIDESGYNLALTAKRNDMRILSVTMGGPGNSVNEGQAGRVHDGTNIMEWAFSTFDEYKNPLVLREYKIPLTGARKTRINLVPAFKPEALTVPRFIAENPQNASDEVKINIDVPEKLKGTVKCGTPYGYIEYTLNGISLEKIPLVCDRTIKRNLLWIRFADLIAQVVLAF
ncbi:MAG: D-alanyl-D-alanine carboxypeptidase [Treponema sp.]|nr:D-alanyl-D-alanine carboxypeptidase [Treponema sp.]